MIVAKGQKKHMYLL